ncbi:hypothetical protein DFP72DRAFT_1060532 [Ephemerocybe angulata]|uniref:Uncharacterized protein n=1 Tax=Ephemerocybe angulata TaxID=980116 RepID=A0A8H6MEZ7_9AGAR|nr:hypothetical protein DFP72DRAFT_1060532 [Tulosesus angulatus]
MSLTPDILPGSEVDSPYRGWDHLLDPIQDDILGYLSLVSAQRLVIASPSNARLVKYHTKERVERLIKSFTLPLDGMACLMRDVGVVISGSAALAVVYPGRFIPGDLDIYVPNGVMDAVHNFLVNSTKYILVFNQPFGRASTRTSRSPYSGRRDETGICVIRYYVNTVSGKVLNVMEARLKVATSAVFMFHCTFVMNFITSSAVVCAYPLMVEKRVGLLNTFREKVPYAMARCVRKYLDRGFRVLDDSAEWDYTHCCGISSYCAETTRTVSDGGTLRILFGTAGDSPMRDLIDPGLRWKLASRFRCYCQDGQDRVFPRSGTVTTSAGPALTISVLNA